MNPEAVVPYIQEAFGGIEGAPRPADEDAAVEPYDRSFPVVITDRELSETEFALYSIDEPGEPATTKGRYRAELVDQVASWIFNRRLQQRVAEGAVAFRQGAASSQDLFNAMRFASASVTGDLADWRPMLADLVAEMKRAREFGFTERELEDARKAIIAQTEQFARIESTLPGAVITQVMLQSVNEEEPLLSAEQSAELMRELLPTLTAEEVSSRFVELHTPERAAFVLTAPEGDGVPTEDELMSAALEALAAEVEAEHDDDRPTELMARKPTPGAIAEMQLHPESGVFSAWFDNGVRFHHREMDYREDSVTAVITVAGGLIQETEDTRGLSESAAVALRTPATSELSSIDIRDLLTGKNVSVSGAAAQDHFTIVVSGSPEDLEEGMKVAHLLLTDAVLEGPAFEQWKQGVRQGIEGRKTQPQRYFAEVLRREWFPASDSRHALLELEDVSRLTRDAAQQWLTERLAEGAIEVSIVGDMPRARAAELAATYVGSVPGRDRITPSTLASRRDVERRDGPVNVDLTIESLAPTAFVFGGFYGADEADVDDVLKMSLAAQILRSRMVQELREERGLVYSIGASSQPADAYPGFGRFFAASPADPGKADELASAIHEMYADFANDGPTQEELDTAKLQLANILDETMKEPSFWTQRLSDMTYRGRALSDVLDAPERLQTFSARDVRRAFADYYSPDSRFTIVIRPEAPAAGDDGAG